MRRRAVLTGIAGVGTGLAAGIYGDELISESPSTQSNTQNPAQSGGGISDSEPNKNKRNTPEQTERNTPTSNQNTPDQENQQPHATFLRGLSGDTLPPQSLDNLQTRKFEQTFDGMQTEYTTKIPENLYQYYQDRVRFPSYPSYIGDQFDEAILQGAADTFEDYGNRNNHTGRQIVDHAIAWVQGMKYTQDKPATGYNEYPKYPVETLYDRGGDCEDTAILLGGVMRKLGYGAVLIKLPQANHMALGIAGEESIEGAYYTQDGTRYYYVETTGEGWRVGQVPDNVKQEGSQAELLPLDDAPSLALEWATFLPSSGRIGVHLTIHNVGTAPAGNLIGQVDIEDDSENIVAQQRESYSTVGTMDNITKQLVLDPPLDKELRLRLGAIHDGTLKAMDRSEFRSA